MISESMLTIGITTRLWRKKLCLMIWDLYKSEKVYWGSSYATKLKFSFLGSMLSFDVALHRIRLRSATSSG